MAFYPIGVDDRVTEVVDLPTPDPGATEPQLEAGPGPTVLRYNAAREVGRVTVTFGRCPLLQFGWPNDEVAQAHPLMKRGLGYHGIYEVRPSGWMMALAASNSIHGSHSRERFSKLRHLIFMLHDETFECLVEGYSWTIGPAR